MPCSHGAGRLAWSGITSRRASRCRTATSRASTAACAMSYSTRRCSSAWTMPAFRSRRGLRTTTTSDRTQPLATRPRRHSPPNCISNGLLRYALWAPLHRPLLTPRSCATKRPGSNHSWWKAGGHVSQDHKEAEAGIARLLELVEKGLMDAEDASMRERLVNLRFRRDELADQISDLTRRL